MVVSFLPNEIDSSRNDMFECRSFETMIQPVLGDESENVIKIEQILIDLAFLKLSPPYSSCERTLEKEMVSSFTSKPAENTKKVDAESLRESSVHGSKLIPTSKPKDESMWHLKLSFIFNKLKKNKILKAFT